MKKHELYLIVAIAIVAAIWYMTKPSEAEKVISQNLADTHWYDEE